MIVEVTNAGFVPGSISDGEARFSGLQADGFDDEFADSSERRSLAEQIFEGGEGVGLTLGFGFDAAISEVADPSVEAEVLAAAFGEGSVADALDSSADEVVAAFDHDFRGRRG
jgi:hypothetical protein